MSYQFQCQSQMLFMFFLILRINKNVIKENKNILVQISAEDTTHKEHKCRWGICETKWYHYKIIMSLPCSESCVMNIFIFDSYLMVTRPKVNLGKYLCSSHLIKKVINSTRNGYLSFIVTLFKCL